MTGNRIQGITVEIGGDTTKLQTAIRGVNSEIRNTQGQLKDVERLLKLDPGNTELLAQKHRLLGDAVREMREKLETLRTAAVQAVIGWAAGPGRAVARRLPAAMPDRNDGERPPVIFPSSISFQFSAKIRIIVVTLYALKELFF